MTEIPRTHLNIDKSEVELGIMKAEVPSGTTSLDFTEWADADVTWADADSEWIGGLTYESTEGKPQLYIKGQRYGSDTG